jgi:hypothetical protein
MTWIRVTRARPCVVCGKPDWCGYTSEPDEVNRCMRVSGEVQGLRLIKSDGESCCYVPIDAERGVWQPNRRQARPIVKKPVVNWDSACNKFSAAFTYSMRNAFSDSLGVSTMAMAIIDVGWCEPQSAYTMPMRDHRGRVVGIRLRRKDGRQFAIRGSINGVFCSSELVNKKDSGPVVICEGPTDTMAMIDMGLWAMGRPSCSSGTETTKKLCVGQAVIIIADADEPGRRGADRLAGELDELCTSVKVIEPPGCKDAREWKARGATWQLVKMVAENAKEWVEQ